eukprot:Seg5884.1 transcript_id=Seg5884.1/GoldUCD/mRNA.D3Y31 product="hypothetical protein" protein_id=Seg5884.1/GoldUCD/D3Y31
MGKLWNKDKIDQLKQECINQLTKSQEGTEKADAATLETTRVLGNLKARVLILEDDMEKQTKSSSRKQTETVLLAKLNKLEKELKDLNNKVEVITMPAPLLAENDVRNERKTYATTAKSTDSKIRKPSWDSPPGNSTHKDEIPLPRKLADRSHSTKHNAELTYDHIICGDSITQMIEVEKFHGKDKTKVISIRGGKINDIKQEMESRSWRVNKHVILHVGTNDISNAKRSKSDLADVINQMKDLRIAGKNIFQYANINVYCQEKMISLSDKPSSPSINNSELLHMK